MDLFSAQVLVHEHAIYIHESVQYHVDRLDWGERKAYVHKIDVDHYTYANRAVTLKPLEVFAEAPATGGRRVHGEVMVASLVTLFKKLKFLTDENVGWGPIDLPELELQTTAYWLTAEGLVGRWRRDELDVALPGAGRAIQTVASVLLMVDPRDLGLVTQVRSPHHEAPTIYLYEAVPGGVGLSERLLERHDELIARRRGADRGLRLRARLPGLHRSAARAGRGCQGARAPAARPTSGADPRRVPARTRRSDDRPPAPTLARRLERYRAATHATLAARAGSRRPRLGPARARRAAGGRDGRRGRSRRARARSSAARCRPDRSRSIASGWRALPGQPPPDAPLVCLDTETTGLATAAGTVAFLIGLGWWEGDRFRQVQLLLPDHADERALLTALAATIPADAWLVTYNGRGFDWPLLVARYRMARRAAPGHAGHLDLLPIVRRLFRHRMADARLRTAEAELLGLHRHRRRRGLGDPGRYLAVPPRRAGRPARRRRPPQRPGRSLAGPAARPPRGPARRSGAASRRRRRATWPGWPARSPGSGGSARRSTASRAPSLRVDAAAPAATAAPADPAGPTPGDRPLRADERRRSVVVAAPPRRLRRTARGGHRSWAAPRGPARSTRRGRPSGSRWTGRTSCDGSGATSRRPRPGRRSRPARVGRPSWPRSSWPSSTSTGWATRPRRCTRVLRGFRLARTAARGSAARSPRSRRT